MYKEQGLIESFQQLLENIFAPLFEVTLDPASHPMLHIFLRHVSGFDLVRRGDPASKPKPQTLNLLSLRARPFSSPNLRPILS